MRLTRPSAFVHLMVSSALYVVIGSGLAFPANPKCAWQMNAAGKCAVVSGGKVEVSEKRTTSIEELRGTATPSGPIRFDEKVGTNGHANVRPERLQELKEACRAAQKRTRRSMPEECIDSGEWLTVQMAPEPVAPGVPAPGREITAADLVSLAPVPAAPQVEPNGWGIIGRPVNLLAPAETHSASGFVLGDPVEVRFTPVQWDWSWGDGESSTSSTGGRRWAELRLPEFSDTDTAHRYAEPGHYTVAVQVNYRAELRDGTGWRTLPGTVAGAPITLPITVVRTGSILVEEK